ncbi:MAG: peptidoglycan DD-metalloendopeptidase family protein [Symploca sp. SIO2G7]|nr:peptidoglycan DD-metalloendopeptidase family protein [Symploca sp. SIO2G7]
MTASDNKFVRIAQKSLFQGSQLFKIAIFVTISLISAQAVVAQTDAGATDLVIPSAAPVVPPTPAAAELGSPNFSEPVSTEATVPEPNTPGPTVIDIPNAKTPPTLDSLLQETQPSNSESSEVNVVSPTDYGTAQVDPTDYSVGATMPEVIISERSSGCEFSLQTGSRVTNAVCRQIQQLATVNGPSVAPSEVAGSSFGILGLQPVTDGTTAASRDYYNQAVHAVVKRQRGEKFIFPLSIPASLTSLFGWRMHPILGARRFHSGTDIGAPLGTPVVATQSGRVTLSDFAGGYGLLVVLRHANDTLESRYAHLSRLLVQAGDWVEQGEVIGLVGSTGNSTGPHLHFELRQLTDSGWIVLNPDSLLRQTLSTLAQALGNSLTALAGKDIAIGQTQGLIQDAASFQGLPFRPAQPHAN